MTKQEFTFSVDLLQAIIWQYNDAERLQSLLESKQAWVNENQTNFWFNWYKDVFDLRTANDFGLQIWAIILGISFTLKQDVPTVWFGFDGSGGKNFNNAGFYLEGTTFLTTEQKRIILQLRYRQMTSKATLKEIQSALTYLFNGALVLDGLDMSLTLTYPTIPSSQMLFILDNYDVIPRPNSVKVNRRFGYSTWFGFDGSGGKNFDNSTFGA